MSFVRYGREIEKLHLELSSYCNIACPGCLRTMNPQNKTTELKQHLTLEALQALFSPLELAQLNHVYACGNLGDPLMNPETLEIFRYLGSLNDQCLHSIHTNGSLRSPAFWRELASALNPSHYVVFGIDGLEDTLSKYRVGSNWAKVLENAQAFIQAGGRAQWAFIMFDYNQHQVEPARQLSQELGFTRFSTIYSHRSDLGKLKYVRGTNYGKRRGSVRCTAQVKKELYVSAEGRIFPCCYLGTEPFQYAPKHWEVDYEDEVQVNAVPHNPTLTRCELSCGQVNDKDIYEQEFE